MKVSNFEGLKVRKVLEFESLCTLVFTSWPASNFELFNLETFKVSHSLALELSSSTGCFKLKLQTFAAAEFDRPSKFESLRQFESLQFEGSTVSNFESSKVRMFEGLKV